MREKYLRIHLFLVIFFLFLWVVVPGSSTFAAINEQINFYGTLKDTSENPLTGTYDMVFRFYDAPTGGTLLDTSTHTSGNGNPVTVTNGEFSVVLGSGTGNALDGIDFSSNSIYVGLTIGADSEMSPRERLAAVPYAFNSDKVDGYDAVDLLRGNASGTISASETSTLLTITQAGSGDILNLIDGSTEVFTVLDGGNVGIGSSSPSTRLSVAGSAYINGGLTITNITATGTSALTTLTSTYASTTNLTVAGTLYDSANSAGTNGYVLQTTGSGVAWVATSSLGLGGAGASTYLALTDTPGSFTSYSIPYTNSGATALLHSSTFVFDGTRLGVGTSTPYWTAQVASATTPYLALTNMAGSSGNKHWLLSNSGDGIFRIGRATDALTSTSTALLMDLVGHNFMVDTQSGTTSSTFNIGIGYQALLSNVSGHNNVAVGQQVLKLNSTGFDNVGVGDTVLWKNTSGSNNVAVGLTSLINNTTGNFNTALGAYSGINITTGHSNVIIGDNSYGENLTTGSGNIGLGTHTYFPSATSDLQLVIGNLIYGTLPATSTSFQLPTTGAVGIASSSPRALLAVHANYGYAESSLFEIGSSTASATTTLFRISNTGVITSNAAATSTFAAGINATGLQSTYLRLSGALYDSANSAGTNGYVLQTTGSGVTWVATSSLGFGSGNGTVNTGLTGYFAYYTADGTTVDDQATLYLSGSNIGIGTTTPTSLLTVYGDVDASAPNAGYKIQGQRVLYASSTNLSTVVGISAGSLLDTSGLRNTAVGYEALTAATSSDNNTAIGYQSMYSNTSGFYNLAAGAWSLYSNTGGRWNTALGAGSLTNNNTGDDNVAVGADALSYSTTGVGNTGVGSGALFKNISATSSVAVGYYAGFGSGSSYSNQGGTFIGYKSGYNSSDNSDYNTFLGYQSGYNVTTGSNNILIGAATSSTAIANLTTGSQNILIGNNISLPSATANGQLNIGNLIYGTGLDGVGSTLSTGNIGIGTTSPHARLSVDTTSLGTTSAFLVGSSTGTQFDVDGEGFVGINEKAQDYLSINANQGAGGIYLHGSTNGSIYNVIENTNTGSSAFGEFLTYNDRTSYFKAGIGSSGTTAGVYADRAYLYAGNGKSAGLSLIAASSSADIRFFTGGETAGDEQMRLTSAGYLGLGTTTPETFMSIAGNGTTATHLELVNTNTSGWSELDFGNTTATHGLAGIYLNGASESSGGGTNSFNIFTNGAYPLILWTNNQDRLHITSGGQIGIGTTSPHARLSIDTTSLGTTSAFLIGSSTGTQFVVTNSGDVGIGTRTPQHYDGYTSLTIGGSGYGNIDLLNNDGTRGLSAYVGKNTGKNYTEFDFYKAAGTIDGYFGYYEQDGIYLAGSSVPVHLANGDTPRLTLATSSKIGIGTTTPNWELQIATATTPYLALTNMAGATDKKHWLLSNSGDGIFRIGTSNDALTSTSTKALIDSALGNVHLGFQTGTSTGTNNVAIGDYALYGNTTGFANIALGFESLLVNTTGYSNISLGYRALNESTTGSNNNGIGSSALGSNTTGFDNNAIGEAAMEFNTTGSFNNGFGYQALWGNTSGSSNIGIGRWSGANNTTGIGNIAFGERTYFPSATGNRQLNIGNLIWGSLPATTTAFAYPTSGAIGIGSTSPNALLSIHSHSSSFGDLLSIGSSTSGAATSTYFVVKSDGKVGIGTTSPNAVLSIDPGQNYSAFEIGSSSATTFQVGRLQGATYVGIGESAQDYLSINASRGSGGIYLHGSANSSIYVQVENTSSNSAAYAEYYAVNDTGTQATFGIGSSNATAGVYAGRGYLWSNVAKSAGLSLVAASTSADIRFFTGGETAGDEQMRITSAGLLGVGTTSPIAGFAVQNDGSSGWEAFFKSTQAGPSSVDIGLQSSGSQVWDLYADTSGYVGFYDVSYNTTPFSIANNAPDYSFIIQSTGKVGIGTSSPAQELSVAGDIYFTGGLYDSSGSIGASSTILMSTGSGARWFATSSLGFGSGSGTVDSGSLGQLAYYAANGTTVSGSSNLFLNTSNTTFGIGTTSPHARLSVDTTSLGTTSAFTVGSSTKTLFKIANNGNVGIGTTSPTELLHVALSSEDTDVVGLFEADNSWNASYIQFKNNGSSVGGEYIGSAGATLGLWTNNTERLTVGATGLVGVGSTSPNALLSVHANSGSVGDLFNIGSSTSGAATSTYFVVKSNGRVGIGTTTPASPLDLYSIDTSFNNAADTRNTINALTFITPSSNETVTTNYTTRRRNAGMFQSIIPASNSKTVSSINGVFGYSENSSTQSVGALEGAIGFAYNKANATVHLVTGIAASAETDAGIIDQLIGLDSWTGAYGGTVNKNYGAYISLDNTGSTIGNRYGLFLATPIGTATNTDYGIYQEGTQDNYLGGKLGIGTTSPQDIFVVDDSSTWYSYPTLRVSSSSAGYSEVGLRLQTHDGENGYIIYETQGGGLNLWSSETKRAMTLKSSGNIGIGTTSPHARLSIDTTSLGTTSAFLIGSSTGTQFVVTNSGDVGIGTRTPQHYDGYTSLTIGGSGYGNIDLLNNDGTRGLSAYVGKNTGKNYTEFDFYKAAGTIDGYFGYYEQDGIYLAGSSVPVHLANGDTPRLTLATSSKIGIGTTTPNWELQIATATTPYLALTNMAGGDYQKHWLLSNSGDGAFRIGTASNSLTSTTTELLIDSALANFRVGSTISGTSYGTYNASIGFDALTSVTSGSNNIALGQTALNKTTSGSYNVGLGYAALYNNTAGQYNTALGYNALNATTFGDNNIGIGNSALSANTSGANNISIGKISGANVTTGWGNIALGERSYFPSATGNRQLNIGNLIYGSLPATTTAFAYPTSGALGIGSTSPTALLSLHANTGASYTNLFTVGSSTASATTTLFNVASNGGVGIGTTSSSDFLTIDAGTGVSGGLSIWGNVNNSVYSYLYNANSGSNAYADFWSENNRGSLADFGIGSSGTTAGVYNDRAYLYGGGGFSNGVSIVAASTSADIRFFTGGQTAGDEQMRLTSSGYLGLGTTTPETFMSIAGNGTTATHLELVNTNASGWSELDFGNTTATHGLAGIYLNGASESSGGGANSFNIFTNGAYPLILWTNNQDRLHITSGGQIGIGTTSPHARLSVDTTSLGTTSAFLIGSSTGTQFVVTNSGNVGIGTSSPDNIFSVVSPYTYPQFVSTNEWAGITIKTLAAGGGSELILRGPSGSYDIYYNETDQSLRFWNGVTDKMTLTNGGKLGIGTTTPNWQLQVASATTPYVALTNMAGASGKKHWLLSNSGDGIFRIGQATDALTSTSTAFLINTTNSNFSVGAQAGTSTGSYNAAIGYQALYSNTAGTNNVAIGQVALYSNSSGDYNTAIGNRALLTNTSGASNLAIGEDALYANTTGSYNLGLGWQALTSNTTGRYNVGFGYNTLANNTTGQENAAMGSHALRSVSTGSYNTGLGYSAGYNLSGHANTVLGKNAGYNLTTSQGSVALGSDTYFPSATTNRQLNIGNLLYGSLPATSTAFAYPTSGAIGIGSTSPTALLSIHSNNSAMGNLFNIGSSTSGAATSTYFMVKSTGQVGIGTTSPSAQLTTTGTVQFAGITGGALSTDANGNVTASSDERLKHIQGEFTRGLDALMGITPIIYKWRDETGYDTEHEYTGFSAQNIQEFIPEAVMTNKSGFLSLSDRPILAAVINAIKEMRKRFVTDELCVGDTCITEAELKDLLDSRNIQPSSSSSHSNASNTTTTTTTSTSGTQTTGSGTTTSSVSNTDGTASSTTGDTISEVGTTGSTTQNDTTTDTVSGDVGATGTAETPTDPVVDETITPVSDPIKDTTPPVEDMPPSTDTTTTDLGAEVISDVPGV